MNEENKSKEILELQEEVKSLKKIIYCIGGDYDENDSGSSIDYMKILKTLWGHKMLYVKVCVVAFVIAAIYAISLPNYYSCTVMLSPEMSGSKSTTGQASLASSFGVNLGNNGAGTEALFPTLYPDLMNSVTFRTSLFPVKVKQEDSDQEFTYYEYLAEHQKSPWWSQAKKAVFSMFNGQSSMANEEKINPFQLTKEQTDISKTIAKKVVCDVDKKTMVITINVTDQDPVVCATMADSVQVHLQEFITDYRTKKARIDLEYNKKLFAEAKVRYEQARKRYAAFADANQRVFLESVLSKKSELENEMQLQYRSYSQVAAQLQLAEAKVQEETPAFTTLQPATVPIQKSGPKRAQMCIVFVFLAFLGTTGWILYKEEDLKSLLGMG